MDETRPDFERPASEDYLGTSSPPPWLRILIERLLQQVNVIRWSLLCLAVCFLIMGRMSCDTNRSPRPSLHTS